MDHNKFMQNRKITALDRVLEFAILIIVNPTAFPRFGGRRQFFYE